MWGSEITNLSKLSPCKFSRGVAGRVIKIKIENVAVS